LGRQYDVHAPPDGPWIVVIQNDLLNDLSTRVIAPLYGVDDAPGGLKSLNPRFEVNGKPMILYTQFLATLPIASLGPKVASLRQDSDTVIRALDTLMSGV